MKCLSLRQPWAWIVVHGGKNIENRKWSTNYRGPFLIHAAKGMTKKEYAEAAAFSLNVNPYLKIPEFENLMRGGIIGRADIVDVIPPCINKKCVHPWHMPMQFGFVLEDIKPLPYRALTGHLGFFNVEHQF